MPKKIFELASELGKGALDIVETLKSHGFNVRNHMTSLEGDELTRAMEILAPTGGAKKVEASAKKVVRKKVVKKDTAPSSSSKDRAQETKVASTVVKKDSDAASESEDESSPSTIVRRKKTIVRRKDEDTLTALANDTHEQDEEVNEDDSEVEEIIVTTEKVEKLNPSVNLSSALGGKDESIEIAESSSSDEESGDSETPVLASQTSPEEILNTKQFGLRIVSQAPVKPKIVKPATTATTPKPVKPANYDTMTDNEKEIHHKKFQTIPEDYDDDSKNKDGAKKRLSGLASMMSGKKSIVNKSQTLLEEKTENELREYGLSSGRPMYTTIKKKKSYMGPARSTSVTEVKDSKRVIKINGGASVEDLAKKLSIKLKDMIDQVLDLNLLIKSGDYVGLNLATEIAALYQYRVENSAFDEDKIIGKEKLSEKSHLPVRSPVITIMGHVDHGKTTLLDTIRKAKVADGEAGGITQHIGAYSVDVKGSKLTFLDTPGHAAFAAMRQRGADVTDIVVLIVAADDGVMPQTRESIKFIQNSKKPLIVAVNKMDRPGANPDRIKQELTEFNITPEEWGGDTQFCPISALKGEGIDALLENIALLAEVLDLREDPAGAAEGVVIESKIEPGRGPVATILVQSGTLRKGDSIVVGETFGRARGLTDHKGLVLNDAGPSMPVQILGLESAPSPGDVLNVVKNEREAKRIAENRLEDRKRLENLPSSQKKVSLEDFFATTATDIKEQKELALIVRSDVQGSFEAIKSAVEALSNPEVKVRVIGGGVGPISESDVSLADASKAFILGFNMRPLTTARKMAEDKGIDVKTYSIIYELIGDVKLAIEGLLVPDRIEEFVGRAEVRDTFSVPKIGVIAGSYVIDGAIQTGCNVRLLRDGKIVFDGKMSSLKRFKDDVKEVKNGYECGIALENYTDIKVGDLFEAYKFIEKKRTLEDVHTNKDLIL